MSITVYGIRNCDQIKRTLRCLEANSIAYNFHDYKKEPLPTETLAQWLENHGVGVIINRRGTTWRKLSDAQKATIESLDEREAAIELICQNLSLIKRPIVTHAKGVIIGFDEEQLRQCG